jgi:hypothetical protein
MFQKIHYCAGCSLLLASLIFVSCSLFPLDFNTTPTKEKMEGAWVLTEAYDQDGIEYSKDINFPITAFHFSSDNTIISTGGPMFMHIVYGGSKYTTIAAKIDQVFNYASLDVTGGEWFIDGGEVDRFTIEMKLEGLPLQKSLTELLSLLGIGSSYLDVTIYHKFMDVKVTFDDDADSVMTWQFDSQTTAAYNKKDKYGNYVLWDGWPVGNFGHDRFVFHKRSKDLGDLVREAKQ